MSNSATAAAHTLRALKPPPAGPAPPAPTSATVPTPVHATMPNGVASSKNSTPSVSSSHQQGGGTNGAHVSAPTPKSASSASAGSGTGTGTGTGVGTGKKNAPPKNDASSVDPQAMYESLKSKIAALEEELNHADEEELRLTEEAQRTVRGMEDTAVQAEYAKLYADMKRAERDHAKEKQKLVKDKDNAKSQFTKANQTKAKLENLARDLTKDNKKLREEKTQLLQDVAKGLEEIKQLSAEITKGKEKARQLEIKNRELPDIVVKVVCKYRAELFFKISRKTKLSRLFVAWTERMENNAMSAMRKTGQSLPFANDTSAGASPPQHNSAAAGNDAGSAPASKDGGSNDAFSTSNKSIDVAPAPMSFIYTHQGRTLDPEMTVEEAGIEDTDEILAVELMDLTGPMPDDAEAFVEARRPKLQKHWADDAPEARKAMEEIFDGVTKERLKLVLRQYELRERHFECFIRSKELELLLAKYRESEQRQLVELERSRIDKLEEDNQQVRKELEEVHNGQTLLIEKLIQCCKEPNAERTQRLFTSLREELEKRGTKLVDSNVGS